MMSDVPRYLLHLLYFDLLENIPLIEALNPFPFHESVQGVQTLSLAEQDAAHTRFRTSELYDVSVPVRQVLQQCDRLVQATAHLFPAPPTRTVAQYLGRVANPAEEAQLLLQEWRDLESLLGETVAAELSEVPLCQLQYSTHIHQLPRSWRCQAVFPLLGIFGPTHLSRPQEVFWPSEPLPAACDSARTRRDRPTQVAAPGKRQWLLSCLRVLEYWIEHAVNLHWGAVLRREELLCQQMHRKWEPLTRTALRLLLTALTHYTPVSLPALGTVFVASPLGDVQEKELQILQGQMEPADLSILTQVYSELVEEKKEQLVETARQCFREQLWELWAQQGQWATSHAYFMRQCQLLEAQVAKLTRSRVSWTQVILPTRHWTQHHANLQLQAQTIEHEADSPGARQAFLEALHDYVLSRLRQFQLLAAMEYEGPDSQVAPSSLSSVWTQITQRLYEDVQTVFHTLHTDVARAVQEEWTQTLRTNWQLLHRHAKQWLTHTRQLREPLEQSVCKPYAVLAHWSELEFFRRAVTGTQRRALECLWSLCPRRQPSHWQFIDELSHLETLEEVSHFLRTQLHTQHDVLHIGGWVTRLVAHHAIEYT